MLQQRARNARRKVLVGIAAFVAAVGAHAQLIVNGGFEEPAFADSGSHYVRTNGTELTGWSSYSGNGGTVLFNSAFMPVAEGKQAVEIESTGDWISQGFATVAGAHYRLSFELSAYTTYGGPGAGSTVCPCASWIDVGIDSAWTTFAGSSVGYSLHTLDFIADSSFTTLTFKNAIDRSEWRNYPHLDNVAVDEIFEERAQLRVAAPIPEPETYALVLGGLALLRLRTARASRSRRA